MGKKNHLKLTEGNSSLDYSEEPQVSWNAEPKILYNLNTNLPTALGTRLCPKGPAPGHRHAQSHGFAQALISLSLLHSQQQPLRADEPMLLALCWGTSTGCLLFLYSSSMNTAPSGLPVWPLWRQPAHLCQGTAGCDPASDTRALICHQSSLMEKVSLPPFLPPSTLYLVPCKEHLCTCL